MKAATKTKRRGIVFTADAVLALVASLAFVALLANSRQANGYDETAFLRLQRVSSDSLNVLEKDGTLAASFGQSDSAASAALEAFLAQTLANNTAARIRADWYQYKPHGNCGGCNLDGSLPISGFCRCRSFNTSAVVGNITTSSSRRMAYYYDGTDSFVALAQMESWLK